MFGLVEGTVVALLDIIDDFPERFGGLEYHVFFRREGKTGNWMNHIMPTCRRRSIKVKDNPRVFSDGA